MSPSVDLVTIDKSIAEDVKRIENLVLDILAKDMYGIELSTGDFTKNVELKVYYGDSDVTGVTESSLRIYILNGEEWEMVTGKQEVNELDNYVTAELEHFSVYCVMGYSDAELKILNMVNYPNPMTGETVFTFELTKDANVKLRIYTVSGRLVKSFEVLDMDAGYKEIPVDGTWDGTADGDVGQLASGVYLWKLTATATDGGETVSRTEKLVIVR